MCSSSIDGTLWLKKCAQEAAEKSCTFEGITTVDASCWWCSCASETETEIPSKWNNNRIVLITKSIDFCTRFIQSALITGGIFQRHIFSLETMYWKIPDAHISDKCYIFEIMIVYFFYLFNFFFIFCFVLSHPFKYFIHFI